MCGADDAGGGHPVALQDTLLGTDIHVVTANRLGEGRARTPGYGAFVDEVGTGARRIKTVLRATPGGRCD